MMKIAPILFMFLSAVAFAEDVNLSVRVLDEAGWPVTNAVVSVETQNRLLIGYGTRPSHFSWVSNTTDRAGVARIRFQCLTADFRCYVQAAGFYPERNMHGRFQAKEGVGLGMDFLSTSTNMDFVLRRRINPIPMYSHGAMLNLKMPGSHGRFGYDLKVCDWTTPHGRGVFPDFFVECDLLEEGETLQYHGKIVFADAHAGAYVQKKIGAWQFRSVYEADTNHVFASVLTSRIMAHAADSSRNEIDDIVGEDEYLVLRTRTKCNAKGELVEANYTKMYGPVRIDRKFRFQQSSFNPNVNDPNLEFDIYRNLNLKSRNSTSP